MPLVWRHPRPPLSSFVSTLWLADAYVPGPHRTERILPTGECSLIVDLGASGGAVISGPHSQSFVISTAAQFAVAGAQFKPGGALPFLDLPLGDLVNLYVPLDTLWGPLAAELRERMLEAPTPGRKLAVLERMLIGRIARAREWHPAVAYAIGAFQKDSAVVRIGDVMNQIGLSHRRFLDLFTAHVGLRPKVYCRVRRFQQVLRHVHEGREIEWASVALSCGYYDQAHFNKEFLAFSGVNPSTYLAAARIHPNHLPLFD